MKVLFVGNPNAASPTMGGAHGFQNTVGEAIMTHDFGEHERFYVTPVQDANLVTKMVDDNKIELVWYLAPYYEPADAPFAMTIWDLAHRKMPWFPEVSLSGWTWDQRQAFYSYVLPRASMIIVGDHNLAADVDHYYHVDPAVCKVIPLPVHDDGLKKTRVLADEYRLLLYPAQFWPHKNHVTLIDMMVELKKRGRHKYRMVFTGADKGNQKYVEEYSESKGFDDRDVFFAGFVSENQMKHYYEAAYAVVFASLMGPDNLPPLEADLYGVPVVCANYPGNHHRQLVFNALDPIDAANKVEYIEKAGDTLYGYWNTPCKPKPFTGKHYAENVKLQLDVFAHTRKLWGTGYKHL